MMFDVHIDELLSEINKFDIEISITLGNVTVNKLITKSFQDLEAS